MRFDREPWRKLYVNESVEHRLQPLLARGLRDYLLRHAKEDGTLLERSEDPGRDLALALGAHPDEFQLVTKYVEKWIEFGWIRKKRGRVWIPNFADAQRSQTKQAARQRRYRERKQVDSSVTRDVTHRNGEASPSDARVTSQKEEKRREETTTVTPSRVTSVAAVGAVPCPADLELASNQRGALVTALVPEWAIDALTQRFRAKALADPDDRRTLTVWRKCLAQAVAGDWNDPRKRPKKPDESGTALVLDDAASEAS